MNVKNETIQIVKDMLKQKNIRIPAQRIQTHWNRINTSEESFPAERQDVLLIQLLDNYECTKKKEVIMMEEINTGEFPVSFELGVLAEDWAGMSNSILGIIHHQKRNVSYVKGLTIPFENRVLGIVLLSFHVNTKEEYDLFLQDKKEILTEIRDAAHGGLNRYILLDDEAVKVEIYNKILRRLKESHSNQELLKQIEESGEILKFVSARSREYLEERSVKDMGNLIVVNFLAQNMVRSGEAQEVIKIKNFETSTEELTGITFVCREDLFSIEDFLKTLEHIVPGHVIRHHKSYVTRDGILVYRIEILDKNARPLDTKLFKSIESSMDKLITIAPTLIQTAVFCSNP